MEHVREWATREAAGIGERVAHFRNRAHLSAQELARRCAALGLPSLSRVVITKLENGHREAVSTAELKVLAAGIGVPPILLLFPLGAASAETLPSRETSPWDGFWWFIGETRDPGGGQRDPNSPISLYSFHEMLVTQWPQDQAALAALIKEIAEAPTPEARRAAEESLEGQRYLASGAALRSTRARMRAEGHRPPDLPPEIAAALGEEP